MPTETPALTAADVFNAAMAVCGYSEKAMADELEVSPSSVNRLAEPPRKAFGSFTIAERTKKPPPPRE